MDSEPGYSRTFASYRSGYSRAFTWHKLRKAVYAHFVEEARAGVRVLEVGCGAGANIKMINPAFQSCSGSKVPLHVASGYRSQRWDRLTALRQPR